MTWEGTPGGAVNESWGRGWQVHVYVMVALGAGNPWTMGPHAFDRLDRGNVMSRAGATSRAEPDPVEGRLWIDVSCDVLDVGVHKGASQSAGVVAQSEAGTCRFTLADPDGTFDPLNPDSPYQYRGVSRLVPGTPIAIWVEWRDPVTGVQGAQTLFMGAVDTWSEAWQANRSDRKAIVTGSDYTSSLAKMDREEQPPIGAGDTTTARFNRILDFFAIPAANRGAVVNMSTATEQETTLAQSAWELLSRLSDDEIGMIWVDTHNQINFYGRHVWELPMGEVTYWGCMPGRVAHDVVIAANVGGFSYNLKNAVYGSRSGGVMQSARSDASIARNGEYSYKRTDLGLADDATVAEWCNVLLSYSAEPAIKMSSFTVNPAVEPACWPDLASNIETFLRSVVVYWTPPDRNTGYEVRGRVVGTDTAITPHAFNAKFVLAQTALISRVWHIGPHANAKLDDGNVIGQFKDEGVTRDALQDVGRW